MRPRGSSPDAGERDGSDAAEATLKSSISTPPGKRDPGTYSLQVYLFRELIAEKSFQLRADLRSSG